MAISQNGLTIFLLLTLIILVAGNFVEFSSPALLVHYEEDHFLPHTREKRDALLAQVDYTVDVELNVTDVKTLDYLRSRLINGSFSLDLGPTVNVTHIDITTVCYPNGTNFRCRCEDQYVWSYQNCNTYGACDEINDDTCGCINSIPSQGQYCQPKKVPPIVYEYQIFIEVNTTDADQLRNTVNNIPFPVQISKQINISDVEITTVCSQDGHGFLCHCEDDYLWPCDKCATYGKCYGDKTNTCGCIKAIPTDGQYCQSINHQNFSVCPSTTTTSPTAPPIVYEYLISVELNISDVTEVNQLRTILSSITYPVSINNHIQISDVSISTVCYPSGTTFQCRCEEQYRWPCHMCSTFGKCDDILDNTCGCINAIPPDGVYCQSVDQYNFTACPVTTPSPSPTSPPIVYEYLISVELNISDVTEVNQLRTILSSITYPVSINNHIQISDVSISTVCYPSGTIFQCRCEEQYRWPCHMCSTFGKCDDILDNTCGCINAIPPDGVYCQSVDQYNFTACPVTTPSPSPTSPPIVYEYLISVELNISDVTEVNQLRTILSNIGYPVSINNHIQISDVSISTVCYPSGTTFQCRCEEQYRWPCHMCSTFGKCDDILDNTCGCINAIPPDGVYCQSVDQYNFTACPVTTPSPSPTSPPIVYEYLISVELNISDVTEVNQLRTILSNIGYPVSINNHIQISDVSISTVCYPSGTTFQCRCEEQYRWPCHMCSTFGKCDDILDNTCGCINAIPPDGVYCQSVDQYNFTACPVTTPSPSPTSPPIVYEYLISVELNISDVTEVNQLRTILSNIGYPVSINNHIQISDVSISTVCYPSGTTFQCRCEEQYRWPCHMCSTFGKCDDILDNTCGCINAIPPDGVYCQTLSDLLICPAPSDETTTVATTQNTTAVLSTPTVITDSTKTATTDVNTTVTTAPTSFTL
ncbi:uncharacterized protein LOC119891055 [Micropterus salmoides]|uniref:uncharacterized protein LOC119891055 n=1 Tax=Micropterus salmoides TaxID=27706 RepID=UPI0018EA6B26|nr:uncharacterized protein LOC119891055 [Micropterus salmoides]